MLAIFLDSIKPEYFYLAPEFIKNKIYYFDDLNIPHLIFTNLDEYLNCKVDKKVAVMHNNFTHSPATPEFLKIFPSILEKSDLVFLVESENPHEEIISYINIEKIQWVLPGFVNDDKLNKKITFKPTWYEIPISLYKNLPDVLESLNPHAVKPKFFDALLGVGREHRDFVYDAFYENNLVEKNIINYHQRYGTENSKNSDFILEPGTTRGSAVADEELKRIYSVAKVYYKGFHTHLACIIHTGIYNQTAYSVVTETNISDFFHLFTEKITKPILGKRLFVVFAGHGYLKSLKLAGFKTFNNIIDESYDNEPDSIKRWSMAFEQIKFLCNQNQEKILAEVKDIVDHNYKLMMETEWAQIAIDKMILKIKNLTN